MFRWESLKNRINNIIINISGKPIITVSVLIEQDIVSPLRIRPQHVEALLTTPPASPKEPLLPQQMEEMMEIQDEVMQLESEPAMESEPVKGIPLEIPLEEAMVVDVQETPDSPVDVPTELNASGSEASKEKKKKGWILKISGSFVHLVNQKFIYMLS